MDQPSAPAHEPEIEKTDIPMSVFDNLEEEREFHQRKAVQFKNKLAAQVDEFKANTTTKAKKGLVAGGVALGTFALIRLLAGTKKRWVESVNGPIQVRRSESLLWTIAKTAAVLGTGYLAKDRIIAVLEHKLAAKDETNLAQPDPATEFSL